MMLLCLVCIIVIISVPINKLYNFIYIKFKLMFKNALKLKYKNLDH